MAKKYRKPSSLPGRILARLFLTLFGFLLGVALFTPWDKIWANALTSLDEKLPTIGLTWDTIDKDGPFSFRVRDFKITMAQTPGALQFQSAQVSMGFSPLAKVRLDTGGTQCELFLFSNGTFEFEGDLNLTYLLGYGDFKGMLHANGKLFMPEGAKLPKSGWVDVRSQQLILPGDKTIQDLAFTAEIKDVHMDIRDFSILHPITYKSAGAGLIDPDNLYNTAFKLEGQMVVGKQSFPYSMEGTLKDAIW